MSGARRSTSRPQPDPEVRTASQHVVKDLLKRNHRLEVPTSYLIVVEGTTDCYYLRRAAELALKEHGVDILKLDAAALDGAEGITVCTPIKPEDPSGLRGGLPQIERLARDLLTQVVEYELPSPMCFLLDHDDAGIEAATRLRDIGYNLARARPETLEPAQHPFACRSGIPSCPLVIEDLLSIRVQVAFLKARPANCDVTYRAGRVVRCGWHKESKAELCEFVCQSAEVIDMIEIIRAVVRVRELWRLSVAPEIRTLLQQAPPSAH